MSNFTKGRWVVWDEKIYALPENDTDDMILIATIMPPCVKTSGSCSEDEIKQVIREQHANGILIAYAPKMYDALKTIHRELPALADSRFDGLHEAVFNAGRLLSRLDIESNVETEDTES